MSCILQWAEHQSICVQILETLELRIPDTIYALICTSVRSSFTLAGIERQHIQHSEAVCGAQLESRGIVIHRVLGSVLGKASA